MTREQFWKAARLLPAVLLLSLLLVLSLENCHRVTELADQHSLETVTAFTQELENHLADGFSRRNDYLQINGTITRVLGIHTLNGRQKLASGALADFPHLTIGEAVPGKIARLQQFVEEMGAGFLCVPMALKEDSFDGTPAPGYYSGRDAMAHFYAMLEENGVNTLNMERWYQENGWGLLDIYFRTDHHWRSEAAFAAFQQIMYWFGEYQGVPLKEETLDLSNWDLQTYEDWFLGSEGKRTSAAYTGVDDFTLITPKFETDWTVGRLRRGRLLNQNNPHSVYDLSHVEIRDWYQKNPHDAYLGGDFPYVYIENKAAVNDQTLVVIGDSFRTQPEVFLSTQFARVHHIDLRYYEDGGLPEFLMQIQPDQVLLLFCGTQDVLTHQYALPEWEENWLGKVPGDVILEGEDVYFQETAGEEDASILTGALAPGSYELTVDDVRLSHNPSAGDDGPGIFLEAALVEQHTGQILRARYFPVTEEGTQRWFFTVPNTGEGSYALWIFNGMKGYTSGNAASIRGLTLTQYE